MGPNKQVKVQFTRFVGQIMFIFSVKIWYFRIYVYICAIKLFRDGKNTFGKGAFSQYTH